MNDPHPAVPRRYWTLNGWLTPDNRLEHLPALLTAHAPRKLSGKRASPLRLELIDANGALLVAQPVPFTRYCTDTPGRPARNVPVRVKVPFREETQTIRFWNGEALVKEWHRPRAAPVLDDLLVEWRGESVRLRWRATHPEGMPMQHLARFRRGPAGPLVRLGPRLERTELEIPQWDLPGGKGSIFQVAATDGFHTTTLDSAPLDLPEPPLEAEIDTPLDGARVSAGRWVAFSGGLVCFFGYEEETKSVQWLSDRDGKLSDQEDFGTDRLSVGTHHITLTIGYGVERTAVGSVTVEVAPPPAATPASP